MQDEPGRHLASLEGVIQVSNGAVTVVDAARLRDKAIDTLIHSAVFDGGKAQALARWIIWEAGQALGIHPATIHDLYMAVGRGECGGFTVPAMNLRGLTYDMSRAVFRAALKLDVGAMIFEIARSEIGYTQQRPAEYSAAVIAAGIKEGFRGPVFIQGDHFQVSARKLAANRDGELGAVKDLIREALRAGFFNIDIDTSTLVDLSQPTVDAQQRTNYGVCAELSAYVRSLEPTGITVSLGGEIGEVGGKNSTEEELRAFMDGFQRDLSERGPRMAGISKISIQTGTSHGGVVLPDGTLAQVKIDFDVLARLSDVARSEYGMAGAVQHGASTLPEEAFGRFVESGACEVHLATGFQNLVYEHAALPDGLRQEVYAYIKDAHADEWKAGETEEQFIYKTRKKGFGPLKAQWWGLPEDVRGPIGKSLEDQFAFLFEKLNVVNTAQVAGTKAKALTIHKRPEDFSPEGELEISKGLDD